MTTNNKSALSKFAINRKIASHTVSLVVAFHGLFILITTLLLQFGFKHNTHLSSTVVYLPLFIGFSLIYLSSQLRSYKKTAWTTTVIVYALYLAIGLAIFIIHNGPVELIGLQFIRLTVLPGLVLLFLLITKQEFMVKSDIQGFRSAIRFSIIALLVAFLYGVVGFSLFDTRDFHTEIRPLTAAHYTIDQFDLTTAKPLVAYTKRAKIFTDSLSFVSVASVGYSLLALFQPIRFRLIDQASNRKKMLDLMMLHQSPSEDFFKLWPHDKSYFFDENQRSGLAFQVIRGVALCLGDPIGDAKSLGRLLKEFQNLCFGNDWLPAIIHIQGTHRKLFENNGYELQKIGQEAVVNILDFENSVANNKYFRHIRNKFIKQDYQYELLMPPHDDALLNQLKTISDEWISDGGRDERGFAMGYFNTEYLQLCPVAIIRDNTGAIQAFLNQIPAEFDKHEATYDMLRNTRSSLGNINDFLLINFISDIQSKGYKYLNLGLCPLAGLNEKDKDSNGLIGGVLKFAYSNGDRLYSFSGLYRFKVKYEPTWRNRYVAYQSGIRGFTRTTNALRRAMRVK
jgi:phosphatidylglycerol lysyltransferase